MNPFGIFIIISCLFVFITAIVLLTVIGISILKQKELPKSLCIIFLIIAIIDIILTVFISILCSGILITAITFLLTVLLVAAFLLILILLIKCFIKVNTDKNDE